MSQWPIAPAAGTFNNACPAAPLRINQGDTLALLGRFNAPSGQDMTGWALTATMWPTGGSGGAVVALTGVWMTIATGDFRLSLTALQTAALALGTYALQLRIVDGGGQTYTLDPGTVEVVATGPGSV